MQFDTSPSKEDKIRLFFEAVHNTSSFNALMESVGECQAATEVANSMFRVENGNGSVFINELLNGRPMIESYSPPAFKVLTDPNIPVITTLNGGEYACKTANPSMASEQYALCESILSKIASLCSYLESEGYDPNDLSQRGAPRIHQILNSPDVEERLNEMENEVVIWSSIENLKPKEGQKLYPFPTDNQVTYIIRSILNEYTKNPAITVDRIHNKIKGILLGDASRNTMRTDRGTAKGSEIRVDENTLSALADKKTGMDDFEDMEEVLVGDDVTSELSDESLDELGDANMPDAPAMPKFITELEKRASVAGISDIALKLVIGSPEKEGSLLWYIDDDGAMPLDRTDGEMLSDLNVAIEHARKKYPGIVEKWAQDIYDIATAINTGEMPAEIPDAYAPDDAANDTLNRREIVNNLLEEPVAGSDFSMSDFLNIVPAKGEGDSIKTIRDSYMAYMTGNMNMHGISTKASVAMNSAFKRPFAEGGQYPGKFTTGIAKFDALMDSGKATEFQKISVAYDIIRHFTKGVYTLWTMAVFSPEPINNELTWSDRTTKITKAFNAMEARGIFDYALRIPDPNLIKAGAPKLDLAKMRSFYDKVSGVISEAKPMVAQAISSYRHDRAKLVQAESAIRNLWTFGMQKPAF